MGAAPNKSHPALPAPGAAGGAVIAACRHVEWSGVGGNIVWLFCVRLVRLMFGFARLARADQPENACPSPPQRPWRPPLSMGRVNRLG